MRDRLRHEASGHTKGHIARRYTVTGYSPKYTRVTFWKGRRKSNFAQVATKHGYGQLRTYKSARIQISKQRNLIVRSMTTVSPAWVPRIILPPASFYFALVPAKKEIRCVLKILIFYLIKFLINRIRQKMLSWGFSTNIHAPEWN
jgi:hypothetical protein